MSGFDVFSGIEGDNFGYRSSDIGLCDLLHWRFHREAGDEHESKKDGMLTKRVAL